MIKQLRYTNPLVGGDAKHLLLLSIYGHTGRTDLPKHRQPTVKSHGGK